MDDMAQLRDYLAMIENTFDQRLLDYIDKNNKEREERRKKDDEEREERRKKDDKEREERRKQDIDERFEQVHHSQRGGGDDQEGIGSIVR